MTDVLDFESRDVPGSVALAGMIGLGKALFEGFYGVLGIAIASSVDDSFGTGVLLFGIAYAIASIMLLRGSRFGTTSRSCSPFSGSSSRSSTCSARKGPSSEARC